jgi:hypothetical protein
MKRAGSLKRIGPHLVEYISRKKLFAAAQQTNRALLISPDA